MDVRIFIEPQQGATYEEQAQVAVATEDAGLDGFFRSDHYLAMGTHPRASVGPTDSWVTLGAIARETSRVRIGTLLSSATFRHPASLAVAAAQVDAMSGGRVELGLGAGWYREEHDAYGIPFHGSTAERLARLDEQLEIITNMWATPKGQTYSFHGRFYELVDSPALPKPQQTKVPIIVGGRGPKRTPARAARFASEFNLPFESVSSAVQLFGALDVACEQTGRNVGEIVKSVVLTTVVGANERECEARAARIGRSLDDLRDVGLAGAPDEVAERLGAYAEAGASRVYLQLLDLEDLDHVALIGSALAPLVAGL